VASVWHVFQECGFSSWLCLLAGLAAGALSVAAIVVALLRLRVATLLAGVALGVALLPSAVGVIGRSLARARVDAVLSDEGIDPDQRARIRVEGYGEADGCLVVGGALTVVPFSLAIIALAAAYASRRSQSAV
jgi:hypothetical protein